MQKTLRPYPTALLNPCADPTFKILFTSAAHESKLALTKFLCDILEKEVTDVVLQPNELAGEAFGDRQSEFDINCKIDGQYANIELQGQNHGFSYGQRAEYHIAHLLNHYTTKGMVWDEIPQVYQISILNFVFDKNEKNAVNHYFVQNNHGRKVGDRMHFIFIELPKIAKLPDSLKDLTKSEMWGKFFLYAPVIEKKDFINNLSKEDEGIKMAVTVLSSISEDEANWLRETRYWMHVSDELTAKKAMEREKKQAIEESCKVAREKGLKEGREEGRNEGLKDGLEEGILITQIKNAKNCLTLGVLSTEQISKITGLSLAEIEKLKKEKN